MKLQALIGKKIKDIKMEIKDYNYDGSIPLEESNSCIVLETDEIVEIPFRGAEELTVEQSIAEGQKSIFNSGHKQSIFERIFKPNADNQKLIKRNTEKIQGKKIVAIYHYEEGFSENDRAWDKCLIEVESGFLVSENLMSPKGTGQTGIWIFTSKQDLSNKIGAGFQQLF